MDKHFSVLLQLLSIDDITQTDPTEDAMPTVSPYQAVTFPFTPAQVCSSHVFLSCMIAMLASMEYDFLSDSAGNAMPTEFMSQAVTSHLSNCHFSIYCWAGT